MFGAALLLALILSPAAHADELPVKPARRPGRLLRAVGLHGSYTFHMEDYPTRSSTTGRSLAAASQALRSSSSLRRPLRYTSAEREEVAYSQILQFFNPMGSSWFSSKVTTFAPAPMRRDAQRVYRRIARGAQRELGMERGIVPGFTVLEGGTFDGENATTLANGAIILQRQQVERAHLLGAAVAAAKSPEELLENIRGVVQSTFVPPATLDPRARRRQQDAVLAAFIGHEMTHAIKADSAVGIPRQGKRSPAAQVKELIADAGALELAVRAGYSPLGVVAVSLYLSLGRALAGGERARGDSHPGWERFAITYRRLERMQRGPRWIYSNGGRQPGLGYFSRSQRHDLTLLPSSEQARAFIAALLPAPG